MNLNIGKCEQDVVGGHGDTCGSYDKYALCKVTEVLCAVHVEW